MTSKPYESYKHSEESFPDAKLPRPRGGNKLGTFKKQKEGQCAWSEMGRGETSWSWQLICLPQLLWNLLEGFKQGTAMFWLLLLKDYSSCWLESGLEGKERAEEDHVGSCYKWGGGDDGAWTKQCLGEKGQGGPNRAC